MSSNCKWPGCNRELHDENFLCPHHGDKMKNFGGIGAMFGGIAATAYSQKDNIEKVIKKVAEQAKKHS